MILRLGAYLFFVLLFCEALSLSAVGWSFFESVQSSLNLIKYTSDNKARDILGTIANVAENRIYASGFEEMNEFFLRLVKNSEKDIDRFTIQEIFLISKDGKVLSHSDPAEVSVDLALRTISTKYNKPYFLNRTQRMKRGQLPATQNIGNPYNGDGSFLSNLIIKLFPEIKNQTMLVSAPIYDVEKLETIGSVHLVYNRGNFLFFMDRQKDILIWLLINYAVVAFIAGFILWGIYVFFVFFGIREGIRQLQNANIIDPASGAVEVSGITAMFKNEMFTRTIPISPADKVNLSDQKPKIKDINPKDNSGSIQLPKPSDTEIIHEKMADENKDKITKNNKDIMDAIYLD